MSGDSGGSPAHLQLCAPPSAAVIAAAPDIQNIQVRVRKTKWEIKDVMTEPSEL